MARFKLKTGVLDNPKSGVPYTCAKFSPQGDVVALCDDTDVLLYNIESGKVSIVSTTHGEPMSDLCWSPDSKCIATASDDFTISIMHIEYGELHHLVGHTAPVTALAYTSKGNLLCSASMDESIKVWDVLTGTLLRTMSAHSEPVVSIDIPHCDPSIISSGSYDGLIRIFDTATGHCLKTLTYDKDWQSENGVVPISQVKFSLNGRYLLVKSLDGVLKLWDFVQGRVIRTFKLGDSNQLRYSCGMDIFYPPDESTAPLVVSGTEQGDIYVWNCQNKQLLQHIQDKHRASPVMSISCRNSYMCSLSLNGECYIWEWTNE